ncbi:MAG: tuaC, partial [Phycisphaerales bacterium]|nr:tuaC [Phycisphaerales bacterium]
MAGPLSDANESLRFELTVNNCVHSVSFDANMLQSPARSTYPHGGSLCGALGPMADEMKDTADAKLRILALTHQYPRLGNELFAPYNRHQIRCLSHGHDIRVIAPIAWTGLFRGGYADHLTCPRHYLNKDNLWVDHPPYFYPPKLLEHRYGDFYLLSIRKTVRRIIDEFKPGVIFSCWSHPDGWAAVRLAREHGLPVLIKVVGSDVLVLARNPRRRERVAEALREADGVIAVSRDLAEHVVELGVDPARVHVVPEGIDQELFSPGDPQEARARLGLEGGPDGSASLPRLLFVGNLLLSKGAGVLL